MPTLISNSFRRKTAMALAAVLLGLAGLALVREVRGGAAPATDPLTGAKGKSPADQLPEPSADDGFRPPTNYRKPDGSIDQKAVVAHQKKRLATINRVLDLRMQGVETPHYLIFSDADAATTGQFVQWSEALYKNLCFQFSINALKRVWDGKCVLLLFNDRKSFEAYGRTFDHSDVSRAGGYFAPEHLPDDLKLVHISIPVDRQDPRRFQEVFAHEGTHAFFELYGKPGHLPLWLHEGLAVYMTTINDRTLRFSRLRPASKVAKSNQSIQKVLTAKYSDGLDYVGYSISFTVVDFLLTGGGPKFKKFVETLKDGKDQNTALKECYGFDLAELENRWRTYMNNNQMRPY